MARNAYIIHPKRGRLLPPYFVAYGRFLGRPTQVSGVLTDKDGKVVAAGRVYRSDARLWALVFTKVPPGQDYRLEVRGAVGDDPAVSVELRVAGVGAIEISYPTDDDLPVGTTFITYGNTDLGTPLSAALDPSSGTVRSLFGPPDSAPYWAFELSDVNPGVYTLSVTGGTSQTNTTVDVQ
ncbi:MAG: hypothetical protein U0871_04660 [Gemmataceae bacterium]